MSEHTISLEQPILSRNERLATELRKRFAETGAYVVNVLSSPGSGKSSDVLATNERLRDTFGLTCAVIEGDIASDVDAQLMKEAGMPAIQINTGGLCHLEGNMIGQAVDAFDEPWAWRTSTSFSLRTSVTSCAPSISIWAKTSAS